MEIFTLDFPAPHTLEFLKSGYEWVLDVNREFKQIATAGATTAAVTEKVWGEYVAAVCQILAK